ncbi:MAG TPA: beta-ketoacyl synthase N-terminal-like domain-containing protein [Bacteroidales bacterium]|nr:beta-ketoacyl synthase N-terminal-like domain-containing protein [Bacteroidales bacterium]HPT09339.1 beta-ketoacyl synthase N-terminal-like domain-containing protein [Bacteroidales bacterium]
MADPLVYINGSGIVSPQPAFQTENFPFEPVSYETNRLKVIDPGYKEFIPAEMIRRMGRIIKMGVASAKLCLRDAGFQLEDGSYRSPEAIVTGTGLGCLEDTEKFLSSMITNKEEFLTPTSFIQSTHNTVAGQIALLLKCHGYNFTFVHRAFSFESALLDAMTRIKTGTCTEVLTGGSDEITNHSFTIMQRMGFWKRKTIQSLELYQDHQRGTIAGEGSSFFLLTNEKNDLSRAVLSGVTTFLHPESSSEVVHRGHRFLNNLTCQPNNIQLIITGVNGNPQDDSVYHEFLDKGFSGTPMAGFKHLCGEYPTASAFALWIATGILSTQVVPPWLMVRGTQPEKIDNILIYNHFKNQEHAFILIRKV